MLYLLGLSSTSWSPAAAFLFEKVIPIFVIDFNASLSLQCITDDSWPQEDVPDQLIILSIPIIFATTLTFLSKVFGNQVLRDESTSRWIANLVYFDYSKLVLSSLEVIRLPPSWSADKLSSWVNSSSFYNALGEFTGLMPYGVVFPFWLLQSISRYYFFSDALAKSGIVVDYCVEQKGNGKCERKYDDPRTKKFRKKKKELFMTIGVFQINLRRNDLWGPGIWMLRKFFFAVFWFIVPDEKFQ